jgi:hypothetical protein
MPTEQQKYIGDHGKALKECYEELSAKYKSFEGKFVPMKKSGTQRSPGKKLYMCVQEKMSR